MERLSVAIIGASGYTGAELVRILVEHPRVRLAGLYAGKSAGQPIVEQFPHLLGRVDGNFLAYDPDRVAREAKIAFLALPHGESVPIGKALVERGVTVLDLSADFRLRDPAVYAAWYGPHGAPELLDRAVYGLPERRRAELRGARLVAVPGCYPTATILALAPLLARGLVQPDGIVVDAKSGVSGAGRTPQLSTHFPEAGEGVRGYKVAEHRHTPEIEQELAAAAGRPLKLTFVPHLIPMSRGILSTCYAAPTEPNRGRDDYLAALDDAYRDEPFVQVTRRAPDTAHVRGSNRVQVSVFVDARAGRVISVGAIDNLVKGAAGQAVQCMNLLCDFPEAEGLGQVALFP